MTKNRVLIIIGFIVVLSITAGAVLLNLSLSDTMDTMKFIEGRYRGGYSFMDHDNSIGVTGPDDIGYWFKNNTWYIQFGKLQLKFTKQNLQDRNYLNAIGRLNLDVRGDLETNDLKWYWCDVQLKEWVPK